MAPISAARPSKEIRLLLMTLALLFPCVLVLADLILRFTHHRPLGAVTFAAVSVGVGFVVRGFVRDVLGGPGKQLGGPEEQRDSLSQSGTDEAPAVSGVVERSVPASREAAFVGLALVLWPLALAWVFLG